MGTKVRCPYTQGEIGSDPVLGGAHVPGQPVLSAALELLRWIDDQRRGVMFHPAGCDVRERPRYREIVELLRQAALEFHHGSGSSLELGERREQLLRA